MRRRIVFLEAAMEVAQNDVVLLFPDLEWSASRVWGKSDRDSL